LTIDVVIVPGVTVIDVVSAETAEPAAVSSSAEAANAITRLRRFMIVLSRTTMWFNAFGGVRKHSRLLMPPISGKAAPHRGRFATLAGGFGDRCACIARDE
jgi:hypothetical protein